MGRSNAPSRSTTSIFVPTAYQIVSLWLLYAVCLLILMYRTKEINKYSFFLSFFLSFFDYYVLKGTAYYIRIAEKIVWLDFNTWTKMCLRIVDFFLFFQWFPKLVSALYKNYFCAEILFRTRLTPSIGTLMTPSSGCTRLIDWGTAGGRKDSFTRMIFVSLLL